MVSAPQEATLCMHGAVYDGQFMMRWDVEKVAELGSINN